MLRRVLRQHRVDPAKELVGTFSLGARQPDAAAPARRFAKALVGQKGAYFVVTKHQPMPGGGPLHSPALSQRAVCRVGVGQHIPRERFQRAAFHVAH